MRSLKTFAVLAALAVAACMSDHARAQDYPTRPITMVVPFPAGGPNDVIARTIADTMRTSLGQPVVMENVGGGAGSIALGRVARATPDGYTIILGNWATHVVNGAVYDLKFSTFDDFAPIALLVSNPALIVARNGLPASDLKELVALLKEKPESVTMGVPGVGSAPHVYGAFFERFSGTKLRFIPYRGGALVMQDLIGGQIDLTITTPVVSLGPAQAGRIKAFAVTAKDRLASAPDIPTVDEAGLPGYYTHNWTALWAPGGTPPAVIAKLNKAVVAALAEPAVRERLAAPGQEIFPREQQTPEALGALQKSEIDKWWPIIKEAKIRPKN